MKIRTKLLTAFALILIIPSIAIGLISFMTAKERLHEELIENATRSVQILDNQITQFFEQKMVDIAYLAETINTSMIDGFESPELRLVLDRFKAVNPDYLSVYYGAADGMMIRSPEQIVEGYDPRERPWYKSAMENRGEIVVNPPSIAASTGDVVVIPSRVTNDGSGVVGGNINIAALAELNNLIRIGEEGYAFIVDQNHKYVAHPTIPPGELNTLEYIPQLFAEQSGIFTYEYEGEEKEAVFTTNELTGWKIIGAIELTEIDQAASGILFTTIIVIFTSILIGIVVIFVIVRMITRPLKELTDAMGVIAEGDFTKEITIRSKDEIGQLATSVNNMLDKLRNLIAGVLSSAHNVAASSQQISSSTQEVASGNSEQAIAAQTISELFNELQTAIDTVAEGAEEASELSNETVSIAQDGLETVQASIEGMVLVNEQMDQLKEDSNEIGNIIEVIDEIAEQTNLLALNAAIEAARAGEQGRGFAVVADEVRKLAERSGEATKQISNIIQEMQNSTTLSVQSVAEAVEKTSNIQKAFDHILEKINESSVKVSEIAAACEEQSAQSREVLQHVEKISANSEEAAAASEETAATSQSLANLAEELNESVSIFKVDVRDGKSSKDE